MPSSTDVCNTALAFLKSGLQITNVDTEQTTTARNCRLLYPLKRDELLTWRPWNWTKVTAQGVVVEQNPNPVWAFSYQKPSDCFLMRRILGVSSNTVGTLSFSVPANSLIEVGSLYAPQTDSQYSAVPFEVAEGLVFTNQPNAIFEYSQSGIPEGQWPAKFVLALAYALASVLAPTLTDGDPFGLGARCAGESNRLLNEMAAQNLNERYRPPNLSEFQSQR